MCICLRHGSAKSRLLRTVAGASNPEFTRRVGHTSTARHESCCRNGQPRRWSAPASEELAKGSKLPTALITCFSHISNHARCQRKNHANVATTPCPSSQSTVPMFASSEARWASLSPQVPRAGSKPSLLWPPRSVPQSCRLKGSRTQHLHRLQVASVASGLSQTVPRVSFMPVSVDPSVSSTIFGLLYKHMSLSHARGKTKHVLHVAVVKHGACESDTEPHLHLRLAEPLVTAIASYCGCSSVPTNPTRFPSVEKSSPGIASRSLIVGRPSGHKLCCFIQFSDCLLVGVCFGRKGAYSSIVFGRGDVGCAENINKTLGESKLANQQFTHV